MKRSKITLFTFIIVSLVLFVSQANAWEETITSDYTLTADLNCSGNGILINASDVTLDGNGYKIIGAGSGSGIYARNQSNIVIKNCTVENFNLGIYLRNISDGEITLNEVDSTYLGIYVKDSSNFEITEISVTLCTGRSMYLRNSSDCYVEDNNVDGSDIYGITIAGSSSTGNTITHNNIKNCEKKTASDSTTGNNTWDSNYYDDAVDWDCDGRTLYVLGEYVVDYNAYGVVDGWNGLPIFLDEDGDGYGVNCPQGTDINDHNSMINVNKEKVFDNFEDGDIDWQYICRPWWDPGECDNVSISILPNTASSGQHMELAITGIDTTEFNYSQYIDIFYVDEERKKEERGMNWTRYRTMTFWVYPVNAERPTTHLNFRIDNDPKCRNDVPYPSTLFIDECREIQKGIHLVSNNWNKVILDLDLDEYAGGQPQGDPGPTTIDNIKSVRFFIARDPRYYEENQALTFRIDDIRLLHSIEGKK